MRAGDLRQSVTVQTVTETDDGHGGFTDTTVIVHARVPARIHPLSGRDLEHARQIDPRISHEVTLRYWRDYSTDLDGGRARLVYHDLTDREFEIVSPPIDVDERHVELTLNCREVA
jgi:SPP1 family predicted phage head-tail adaptor